MFHTFLQRLPSNLKYVTPMWQPPAIGASVDNRHTLTHETNRRFWARTGYKPGQRLDMQDPHDRAMSKVWLQIFNEVTAFRKRAHNAAWHVLTTTGSPYVLVAETQDGLLRHSEFPQRLNLDVQLMWIAEQPDLFRYAAAFDFTADRQTPIQDIFSTHAN